ncbi:hypothetical protein LMG19282_02212 [Cupriavidus campinensis]|nr:hypothetical protein LMG19282_02212 [Cupriavidus campinensis]
MPECVHTQHERPEHDGRQHGAGIVELARLGGRLRQRGARDRQRGKRHGNIHGEQPWPATHGEDQRAERRPDRNRHPHDQRVEPDAAPELGRRVDEAHQRGVHAHDAGAADALQHPRRHQHRQVGRQRAEHRADQEGGQTDPVHALVAEDVAQRRQRQQADGDRELVGVYDPDGPGGIGVERPRDGRQRDIGNGAVQHGHDQAAENREDGPGALGLGKTLMGRHGRGRLGAAGGSWHILAAPRLRWKPDRRGRAIIVRCRRPRKSRFCGRRRWPQACGAVSPSA